MAVILVEQDFRGDPTFDKLQLWVIPVAIEGEKRKVTFNLLLDTGAQRTVLLPDVDKIVDIEKKPQSIQGSGVGGASQYSTGTVRNLEIGSIALGSKDILVGILPGVFSKYNIDGILGADVLQMLCLKIEYPEKLLVISKTIVLPGN